MTQGATEIRQGFTLYQLQNERVRIEICPELGAKIVGLTDLASGREWMWTPPDRGDLFRNRTGDPFQDSTIIGADECIPTIAPSHWQGRDLPDHGEAWSEAWSVDDDAFDRGAIVTYLRFPVSPLEMVRAVTLEGSTVRLRYRLTNLADEPTDYIWALHPLMNIHPGDRLLLPAEVKTLRTDAVDLPPWRGRGVVVEWPQPGHGLDLSRLDLGGEGRSMKLFTEPLKQGLAAIHNEESGDYLVFAFDAAINNTLGIWINRGGWNGYQHVALEPGNGAPDPLALAVQDWKRFTRLQPGETVRWDLDLHLGQQTVVDDEAFLAGFVAASPS